MDVLNYHRQNLKPVSAVYTPDPDIKLRDQDEFTKGGLDFTYVNILSSLEDTTTNNYTNMYLSEKKDAPQILRGTTPKLTYPIYRTTYLKLSGLDSFLTVTNSTVASGLSADANNSYYFELEILDANYLAIRHYDGTTLRYLTLNESVSTTEALNFQPRGAIVSKSGGTIIAPFYEITVIMSGNEAVETVTDKLLPNYDVQIFEYVLDDTANTLSLLKSTLTGAGWDEGPTGKLVFPGAVTWHAGALSAVELPASNTIFDEYNTFNIQPVKLAPSILDLQTTWNSYTSAVEDNTLNVNANKSLRNIENNILIHSATNSISSDMGINLVPLKNQLTVEGNQSRNNPYSSTENTVHHRDYHHLHTGTYQDTGTDYIYLDYTSGVKQLVFLPSEITYFHAPNIFAPYSQVNINDTSLIESGAIWADVPIKADKVFKKREISKNMTNVVEETEGTLLCSWLSGNSNPSVSPIWVDRYYNPDRDTYRVALTSNTVNVVTYQDKFTSLTKKFSAGEVSVYDKISDLVFEPGTLYGYYHIGNYDSNQIITTLSGSIIASNLDTYSSYKNVNAIPTYEANIKGHHTMVDGTVMTGKEHDSNSVYVPPTYSFYNNNYGTSNILPTVGSFTIAFWMYSDAWDKPFADQLLGTYITNGFGIFNEPFVTPFTAIPNGDKVHIYNSDYKHIDIHTNNKTVKHITKRASTENYWFIDTSNDIYEYDTKGAIQNKIATSKLPAATDTTDIDIDDTHLYVAILTSTEVGNYFKYDLKNQSPGYTGNLYTANVWNSGANTNHTLNVHSVKKGLSAATGVILTAPDTGLTQGSVIDNLGNPWVIQNNSLYTYDTTALSNIQGISAAGSVQLEAVNCDKDNNIWLLYGGTKLTKFDTNRKALFTISLSGTPYSSTRYIDFIYEFNSTGYEGYANILNQSVSGARVISVNLDGTVRSESSVLTGSSPSTYITHTDTNPISSSWKTTTGFSYLRNTMLGKPPRLDAKIALTNIYNSSTTTAAYSAFTLSYNLSGMKSGWHHVGVVFDAEQGNYEMFIDAVSVNKIALDPGKFSFSKIFTQPLAVGTSPFYTNVPLFEHLDQPQSYLVDNTKIKRLTVYDKPLSYFDLRAHYLIDSKIENVSWDIPTGQRNYIDTVERVFKHRLPGRKSEIFNINIKGLSATDISLKQALQSQILQELNRDMPIYTKVNKVLWDSTSIATSSAPVNIIPQSIHAASPVTTPSTTQISTGESYAY